MTSHDQHGACVYVKAFWDSWPFHKSWWPPVRKRRVSMLALTPSIWKNNYHWDSKEALKCNTATTTNHGNNNYLLHHFIHSLWLQCWCHWGCLSLALSSQCWSPCRRLWRLCQDTQPNLPVLLPLLPSHRCHQQSGGLRLFSLQCWQCLHDLLRHLSWSFPEMLPVKPSNCLHDWQQPPSHHFKVEFQYLCTLWHKGTLA